MNKALKKLFDNNITTCQLFYKQARKAPLVGIFFGAAFATQLLIGYYYLKSWWAAVVYPLGSFFLISIAGVIIYHFTKKTKRKLPEFRFPRLQLLVIILVVLLHFIVLLGQFPNAQVSENIVTVLLHKHFLSNIMKPFSAILNSFNLSEFTRNQINIAFLNIILCVLLSILFHLFSGASFSGL